MSESGSLAGRLTEEGHVLAIRVYYEDTDFSGSVYHASFVRFLERGRSDLLRLLGITHTALDVDGFAFAVSEMNLRFRRTAQIDDVVEVATSVRKMTGARVVLDQCVRRGAEMLVEAEVTVALVDRDGRARRFPAALRDALIARMKRQ